MISSLDHVVVVTGDIAGGTAAYQTLFAQAPSWSYSGDGATQADGRLVLDLLSGGRQFHYP